jgi:8-oxo-dGTP pyrophosphatase MutT (NUDIX family)
MDFSDFLDLIPLIKNEILPGEQAHQKMSPPERTGIMKNIDLQAKDPKQAAVMMLFYPRNEKTQLILIIRNSYPGVHSAQIAFPGGKVETYDDSLTDTALRETEEEVGIISSQITIVRAFSSVYIPPSNFMAHPFLGYSTEELIFRPDPSEVAGIIELPLEHLLDEANAVIEKMATSYSDAINVPAFIINEHRVWGATAMMLSELKDVLKRVI